MTRLNFYSLILLFSSFFLTDCTKKTSQTTEYIPAELKDYALFQPGSYWIYLNEVSGDSDSSFISKKPEFNYYIPSEVSTIITELCSVYYEGPFLAKTDLSPSSYVLYFPGDIFEAIKPISFSPGQSFNLDGATTLKYLPLVDSMKIADNTFYNVFITQWQYISSQHDTTTNTCYFVKKVGLIKFRHKEAASDSTWYVIRFHAVQ
jgi:hypothetical protein